jgi:hypothetical protein
MAAQPERNEGFRLLDEFVCQAVPGPAAVASEGRGAVVGRGENAGMQIWEELALSSAAKASPPEPAKQTSPGGLPLIELVIDRDFSSYTAEQQAGLLSALRELLVVTGEVRVVKRVSGK